MELLSGFGDLREFWRDLGLAALCAAPQTQRDVPPMCTAPEQFCTENHGPMHRASSMHRASHPVRYASNFAQFSPSFTPFAQTRLSLCSILFLE